jgi:hypothetical protein
MTAHAKKNFRPTLETLENREMMDAGIRGAVMHPMMPEFENIARFITATSYLPGIGFSIGGISKFKIVKECSPLSQALTQANQAFLGYQQHKDNPTAEWSQALTQANQAFLAQSQQLNANLQAVDHIFSAASPTGRTT